MSEKLEAEESSIRLVQNSVKSLFTLIRRLRITTINPSEKLEVEEFVIRLVQKSMLKLIRRLRISTITPSMKLEVGENIMYLVQDVEKNLHKMMIKL